MQSFPNAIDSHIHIYPEFMSQDPLGWAQQTDESHWARLVMPQGGKSSLQAFLSPQKLLDSMKIAGVSQAVIQGWYWQSPQTCYAHNAFMADLIQQFPEKLAAVAAFHPGIPDPVAYLEQLRDQGFRGLGELFLSLQGFSLKDVMWRQVLDWCIQAHWPITLHVTEAIGRPHPGSVHTSFEPYLELAQSYPDLRLVLAHWGGLLPFYELNPFVRSTFRNVYYDTAASPLLYDNRIWRSVLDVVGPKKILFGSDFPLRLYPALSEPTIQPLIAEARTHLNPSEWEPIFCSNAYSMYFN